MENPEKIYFARDKFRGGETPETLDELDANAKRQKLWKTIGMKKSENQKISRFYAELADQTADGVKKTRYQKKAAALKNCCNNFYTFRNRFDPADVRHQAMRCRNRLCPTCDSLNSLKTFAGIISALNLLSENQKFFALFLTLTQKNCLPDDLTAEIDKMIYAWNRLTKKIKVRILGYYRTLEVTCNQKTKTFHPHFHAILIVAPDYYLAGGWRYMSQSFIQKCWRKFMCLSYTPQVRIQAIQSASNKAICEVAKYTVKSSDVQNSEVLAELDTSLKSRRLHGCGGILKTAKSKSKADYDAEKVILLGNPDFIAELYRWDCFAEKFVLVKDERPTAEEAVTKIFAGA